MRDELLYRYFNNEAAPEEVQQIEEWLKADSAHQAEFDAAHMLFNAMILQQVRAAVPARPVMAVAWMKRRAVRVALRIAAAVALIAGAGYLGGVIQQDKMYDRMADTVNVLEVPAGQRISLSLADGTVVCLNGGSRLEYPLLFAKNNRRVKLSGEALFEVVHDAASPFVVETFASEIEVLGTKFNVYADTENHRFSTTLIEGRVKASNLLGSRHEQFILNPDEMVQLVDGHLVLSRASGEDARSWTQGYINIRNVAFDELMSRFEDSFGVKIVIDRKTLPQIEYVSGKIRVSEGIDFALHLLQQASDFTYTEDRENNTIIIR